MPKITGMVVKEAKGEELTELFIRVGRLQYIIIALVVSGFTVFGRSFIILWAGSEYINAYWIAILTLFPLCIPLIQNTGVSIVVAQNKHKFRSMVYLLIAILNVISTYCVVPYWGGIGAAFCSCISYLLGQGIIMNWFYYKKIGIDIPSFWRNIASMSVIPGGMLMIGIVVFKKIEVLNWSVFFIGIVVYTLIYCAGMYIFSLNNYEKDIIDKYGDIINSIDIFVSAPIYTYKQSGKTNEELKDKPYMENEISTLFNWHTFARTIINNGNITTYEQLRDKNWAAFSNTTQYNAFELPEYSITDVYKNIEECSTFYLLHSPVER